MPDLCGHYVGRYHLLEKLGQGGMADVYRAFDTTLERYVAIKIIRRDAFAPEVIHRMLARFKREAQALARLDHPNIVKVLDFGEHEGAPYLVMQYVPGGTLKEQTGAAQPWRAAARILLPVARALQYAHTQGIIHRDVKPANILLSASGEPMISDFGIAKVLSGEAEETLTATGTGVGTPEYMAPEQAQGSNLDGRADIYALGIVFFELVTGKRPFQADTPLAVILKHLNDPLPRPSGLVPSLPAEVENVIIKALAKKPENRYTNMGLFADALERMPRLSTADESVTFDAIATPNKPPKPHKRTALLIAIPIVLVFVVLLLLSRDFWIIPEGPRSSTVISGVGGTNVATIIPLINQTQASVSTVGPLDTVTVEASPLPDPTETQTNTPIPVQKDWRQGQLSLLMLDRNGNSLYTLDLSDTNSEPVLIYQPSEPAILSGAAFSPDGNWIAYYKLGGPTWLVEPRPQAQPVEIGNCEYPSFSGNGDVLLCQGSAGTLYHYDLQSRSKISQYALEGGGLLPFLDPTGSEVVYAFRSGNTTSIRKQSLVAGVPIELAANSSENYAPAWSLDGKWIAFQSTDGSALSEVWTMAPDGNQKRRLTNSPSQTWSRAPTWSGDNQWLYFVSNQAGSIKDQYGEVFAVSFESGEVVQVTNTGGMVYNWRISWGP